MCAVKPVYSWLSLSALSFSRENQGSSGAGQGVGEVLCDWDFASSTHSHPKHKSTELKPQTILLQAQIPGMVIQRLMDGWKIMGYWATTDVENPYQE